LDPCLLFIETWTGVILSDTPALIGQFTADGVFKTVEGGEAIKGLCSVGGRLVSMLV